MSDSEKLLSPQNPFDLSTSAGFLWLGENWNTDIHDPDVLFLNILDLSFKRFHGTWQINSWYTNLRVWSGMYSKASFVDHLECQDGQQPMCFSDGMH